MSTSSHALKIRDHEELGNGSLLTEEKIGPLGILFIIFLIATVAFILDYGVLPPVYKEKDKIPAEFRARLDFQYNDPNELRTLRDEAARRARRVYSEAPDWSDGILRDLTELISIVEVAHSASDARDRAARFPKDAQLVEDIYKYNVLLGSRRKLLSTMLLEKIRWSLKTLADNGVLSSEDLIIERNKPGELREIIRLSRRNGELKEERISIEQKLIDVPHAIYELERAGWREGLPRDLERQLIAYFTAHLTNNLILDKEQTCLQIERAKELVGNGDVQIRKNDILLSKGLLIGRSELDKLHHEWAAYKRSLPFRTRMEHWIGLAVLALAMLLTFIFIISRVEEAIFRRRRALVMLGLLVLAALAGVKALLLAGYSMALAPCIFVGMVASLAFGQIVALLTLLGLCLLSAIAEIHWEAVPLEGTVPILTIVMFVGGVSAALPAARLRHRWDLLKYSVGGGLLQFVLAAGMSLLGGSRGSVPITTDAMLALINGPLCGLLVLGSLPVVESLFGILTNIRLFELADLNQPALRRIQLESPGTFAHTLMARNLAEPAAESIGANTRLVSVGMLYHDFGKTLKPEYFIENQMSAEERHRRLRPSVSALLITAHVKDGLELAYEYGLPQRLVAFIPEHHGTTLVSYFYHSAKKDAASVTDAANANSSTSETVQEAFFRYPGPKPQSRETAIAMLADTVEAATRTLNNPSAARLRSFAHELIMEKMLDGQLDECDMTFADLAKIEAAFLRVLVTRFHSRIPYPGQKDQI
ncbi:MAG: HDIG domain-containing metalloprotein [Planctomycetota bacterium]